jgi:predicted polyphosphate/ATP-dependent NAD kinase
MKKLGVIVNPVAGMGGRVGLKGSDGMKILERAKRLGAVPESPSRAIEALRDLARFRDKIELVTYPGEMGEEEARACGFTPVVLGSIRAGQTTAEDTRTAAQDLSAAGVDLILFAGGDGTARDIYNAIGDAVPVLGIPAGVKIHSAVYAVTPRSAGEVAVCFLEDKIPRTRESEVMDIDEQAFREDRVTARLYGYLKIPDERRLIQSVKAGGFQSEEDTLRGIAHDVIETMQPDTYFIVGPGTTTRTIMQGLGLKNTLLGVDLLLNRKLVANDMMESRLFDFIKERKARIIVTIIGGQGHIFGRGNQQISPRIIKRVGKEGITVITTKEKLASLRGRPLLVDTGDEDLNRNLCGYMRLTTGYGDYVVYRVGYENGYDGSCAIGVADEASYESNPHRSITAGE